MATDLAASDALDELPLRFKAIFVHMGRILQHATRHDVRTLGRTAPPALDPLNKASRGFHETLDDLELQILRAKAVLERDLRGLEAKPADASQPIKQETSLPTDDTALKGAGLVSQQSKQTEAGSNGIPVESKATKEAHSSAPVSGRTADSPSLTRSQSALAGTSISATTHGATTTSPSQKAPSSMPNTNDAKSVPPTDPGQLTGLGLNPINAVDAAAAVKDATAPTVSSGQIQPSMDLDALMPGLEGLVGSKEGDSATLAAQPTDKSSGLDATAGTQVNSTNEPSSAAPDPSSTEGFLAGLDQAAAGLPDGGLVLGDADGLGENVDDLFFGVEDFGAVGADTTVPGIDDIDEWFKVNP